MNFQDYLILALGVCSSVTLILSGLSTHRKRLLGFALATSIIAGTTFMLSGSFPALLITCVSVIRTGTAIAGLRYPILNHWGVMAFFLTAHATVFTVFNDFSQMSTLDYVPVVAAMLSTVAFFFQRVVITKAFILGVSSLWVMYEFKQGLYGMMIGETFTIVANVAAIVVLTKAARAGIPESAVENLDTQVIGTITTAIPVVKEHVQTAMMPVIRSTTETLPIPHIKNS